MSGVERRCQRSLCHTGRLLLFRFLKLWEKYISAFSVACNSSMFDVLGFSKDDAVRTWTRSSSICRRAAMERHQPPQVPLVPWPNHTHAAPDRRAPGSAFVITFVPRSHDLEVSLQVRGVQKLRKLRQLQKLPARGAKCRTWCHTTPQYNPAARWEESFPAQP